MSLQSVTDTIAHGLSFAANTTKIGTDFVSSNAYAGAQAATSFIGFPRIAEVSATWLNAISPVATGTVAGHFAGKAAYELSHKHKMDALKHGAVAVATGLVSCAFSRSAEVDAVAKLAIVATLFSAVRGYFDAKSIACCKPAAKTAKTQ